MFVYCVRASEIHGTCTLRHSTNHAGTKVIQRAVHVLALSIYFAPRGRNVVVSMQASIVFLVSDPVSWRSEGVALFPRRVFFFAQLEGGYVHVHEYIRMLPLLKCVRYAS